jgi:predicted RNase H-like HicB family nuclease
MQTHIVFEPSDEGGYTVFVPALPGCISEGDTLEAAEDPQVPEGGIVEEIAI